MEWKIARWNGNRISMITSENPWQKVCILIIWRLHYILHKVVPGSKLQSQSWCLFHFQVKYGFHSKSFILNVPLVSFPIPVFHFGWVQQQTHPKQMTGIGQLTRGAFRINDLLWNPYLVDSIWVPNAKFSLEANFWNYIFMWYVAWSRNFKSWVLWKNWLRGPLCTTYLGQL